jgi:hypothetical protein
MQSVRRQLPQAFNFTLSNQAILEFDRSHPASDHEGTPVFIQWGYDILLFFVDRLYEGRAIERFWFLETVRCSSWRAQAGPYMHALAFRRLFRIYLSV